MKDFIDTYAKAWENEHALRGQVNIKEFLYDLKKLFLQKFSHNDIYQIYFIIV